MKKKYIIEFTKDQQIVSCFEMTEAEVKFLIYLDKGYPLWLISARMHLSAWSLIDLQTKIVKRYDCPCDTPERCIEWLHKFARRVCEFLEQLRLLEIKHPACMSSDTPRNFKKLWKIMDKPVYGYELERGMGTKKDILALGKY